MFSISAKTLAVFHNFQRIAGCVHFIAQRSFRVFEVPHSSLVLAVSLWLSGMLSHGQSSDGDGPPTATASEPVSNAEVQAATLDDPTSNDSLDRMEIQFPPTKASRWLPPVVTNVVGRIETFDSEQLVYVDSAGETQNVPSAYVASISPAWVQADSDAAIRLLAKGDFREAIQQLDSVRRQPMPRWQQQLLIAGIVQAAEGMGNIKTAGVIFDNLISSSPPTCFYADAPLCWTTQEADVTTRKVAEEWLAAPSETLQLLGASWLLFDAKGSAASQTLKKLTKSQNANISLLAELQSWRLTTPTETLGSLEKWFTKRDTLLQPLQLGPTEFIADRLGRIGELNLALGEWFRIATVHCGRYHREARAKKAAMTILTRQGTESQAVKEWALKVPEQ